MMKKIKRFFFLSFILVIIISPWAYSQQDDPARYAILCNGDLWMTFNGTGNAPNSRHYPNFNWPASYPAFRGWITGNSFFAGEYAIDIGQAYEDGARDDYLLDNFGGENYFEPNSGSIWWEYADDEQKYKTARVAFLNLRNRMGLQMKMWVRTYSLDQLKISADEILRVNDMAIIEIHLINNGFIDYNGNGVVDSLTVGQSTVYDIENYNFNRLVFGLDLQYYLTRTLTDRGSTPADVGSSPEGSRLCWDPKGKFVYAFKASTNPGNIDYTGLDDSRNKWWGGATLAWFDIDAKAGDGNPLRTIYGTPATDYFASFTAVDGPEHNDILSGEDLYWSAMSTFMERSWRWAEDTTKLLPSSRLFPDGSSFKIEGLTPKIDVSGYTLETFPEELLPMGDDKLNGPKKLYEGAPQARYSWGPFQLAHGDSIILVIGVAVGPAADHHRAENYKAWLHKGTPGAEQIGCSVYNQDYSGADVAAADENALDKALAGVRAAVRAAEKVYEWGYRIPNPPPAPEIAVVPQPDETIKIFWKDNAESPDPDYQGEEANDFAQYSIYRSHVTPLYPSSRTHGYGADLTMNFQGEERAVLGNWQYGLSYSDATEGAPSAEIMGGSWGPYYLLQEITNEEISDPVSPFRLAEDDSMYAEGYRYVFTDASVSSGFRYYYTVIATDKKHNSGWYVNGQKVIARLPALSSNWSMNFNGWNGEWPNKYNPYLPINATILGIDLPGNAVMAYIAASADLSKIYVSPNPYDKIADWDQEREHKIQFNNLPKYCNIHIYDMMGRHIKTIEFDADVQRTGGIYQWDMYSKNGNVIGTGVYLYRVEGKKDFAGVKSGTFVIVR